ncbi:MAG: hypothetical protein HQM10_23340 [Candidatus Riflebacteria bacterium]|nr:hypothetical protein [Candidatus Riflebacteria bacterium]
MRIKFLFVALMVFSCSMAFSQGLDEVIVSEAPAITMKSLNSHLRLMEYALGTRLTTSQKEILINSIRKECSSMEPEERKAFLEADALVASMTTMPAKEMEIVKQILNNDYEENVRSDPTDQAAQLYTNVSNAVNSVVVSTASESFNLQSLEAYAEYLGFCRSLSGGEKKLSQTERDQLQKFLIDSFERFPLVKRRALSGFDGKWHLIRAGLQFCAKERSDSWKESLKNTVSGLATFKFQEMTLDVLIPEVLWSEIADAATETGETGLSWTASPAGLVW